MSHAVIRIVSFLILTIFLTLGNPVVVTLCILLTAILYFINPPQDFSKLLSSILRMKWFFFSIVLVYLFLDPVGGNMFSQLSQGGKRILILLLIFLLVNWLIRSTPREQLIAALISLLSPLGIFGFPVKTFALRIELVLANILIVQNQISESTGTISIRKKPLKETGRDISGLYQKIISASENASLDQVNITHQLPPSLKQWIVPVFLTVFFYVIHNYL